MKILMCVFDIMDLGGIINHAEHLIHGLKSIGHTVDLVRVEDKEKLVKSTVKRKTEKSKYSGMFLDQNKGWVFTTENRIAFKSTNWKSYTSKYDLVLWEIPIPSKQFEDCVDDLYNIKTPQICFIHDGNMVKLYPHVKQYEKKFEFFACVHDCAMGNALELGIKNSRLIVNPQVLENRMLPFKSRKLPNICSFQTFKAWKRVHELVRASTLIDAKLILGGGGIEYYYMTSKTKRKPQYGTIWEDALENGMEYVGYVSEEQRDAWLQQCKFLVDASWSKNYSKYGSHFNRVMVDSIIKGTLPILRDLAMDNNSFFTQGEHYYSIPFDATQVEFANDVNIFLKTNQRIYKNMVESSQHVVKKYFDSKKVAKLLLM